MSTSHADAPGQSPSNGLLSGILRSWLNPDADADADADARRAEPGERPRPTRWLPAAIHWGITLAPLGAVGLATVAAPWMLLPFAAAGSLYSLSLLEPWRARPAAHGTPVRRRVAIVGAGPSGLVTVKEFAAAGHDAVCFEATASVGGVFSHCYDGAQLTSSAAVTAFSDFPPNPDDHRHWTKDEYVEYLERYVDHFGIRRQIRLEHRVEQAHFDEAQNGWIVTTHAKGEAEPTTHGPFDTLVVCSGLNQTPNLPNADPAGFRGQIVHSKDYHNAAPFAGKRVVVVGLGETGADVVAEVAEVASSVVLSLRRGAYVIPRINPRTGFPNDYDSNRLRYALPKWAHSLAVSICDRAYARWGPARPSDRMRVELLRIPGTSSPFRRFATKSDNFVGAIERKLCRIGAGFVGFTENGVELADGEEVPADVVLFATGFRAAGYGFIDDQAVPHCPSQLWHLMYSSEHRERLVFIGFARPSIGAIPPIAEVQARYAALVTSGERKLPDQPQMMREPAERRRAHAASFDEPRLVTLVDWIPYMDQLAARIGCRPQLGDVLLRPRLAWQLATGPMLAAQYRLSGPDAKPELAEQSLEVPGGMRLRDKLWFFSIHALVAGGTLWEALPARRRYRACSLV